MTQKLLLKLFIIFISTYTVITFLFRLAIALITNRDYSQYTSYVTSLSGGTVIEGINWQIITIMLSMILISPILEEFIYRSWLTKKTNNIKTTFFVIFICILFGEVIFLTPFREFFYNEYLNLTSLYFDIFYSIYPPVTLHLLRSLVFNLILLFPVFIIFKLFINFCFLKLKKISLLETLRRVLNNTNPILIILLNTVVFSFAHFNNFNFSVSPNDFWISAYFKITLFLDSILFGFVAYRYSLRLSILLHILYNFFGGILILKGSDPNLAIVLYYLYFAIFVYLLVSILLEIKKQNNNRELLDSKVF